MAHLPDLVQQVKDNAISEENARWQESTGALIEPAHALVVAINEGLEHAGLQLGVVHKRLGHASKPACKDAESRGDMVQPGDPNFSAYLESKLNGFSLGRLQSLAAWTSNKDVSEKEGTGSSQLKEVTSNHDKDIDDTPKDHRQLNLVLYTHQMVSQSVLALRIYTDNHNRSCTQLVWLCLSSATLPTVYIPKA